MKKLAVGLGIVAGGLLLLLIIGNMTIGDDIGPTGHTLAAIVQLSDACQSYAADGQRFPAQIDNKSLVKILSGDNVKKFNYFKFSKQYVNADGEMLDGWKTPLRIVMNADGSLTLISAGRDFRAYP